MGERRRAKVQAMSALGAIRSRHVVIFRPRKDTGVLDEMAGTPGHRPPQVAVSRRDKAHSEQFDGIQAASRSFSRRNSMKRWVFAGNSRVSVTA